MQTPAGALPGACETSGAGPSQRGPGKNIVISTVDPSVLAQEAHYPVRG